MRPCHLSTFFKSFENKTKLLSLEVCTNRELNISKIIEISPPFCSVTWLDNKVRSFNEHPTILLSRELIKNDVNVLIHLPGRIYDRQEMLEILKIIKDVGIRNILAIQGENSLGESKGDFPYAYNLVEFIKQHFNDHFCIGVTGYPSGHPRSPNLQKDLEYLKQKVDGGASFIITQAVFDIETFTNFYRNCKEHEINVPIVPGVFIINTYSSLLNMVKFCKLLLPDNVMKFIEEHKEDEDIIAEYGVSSVVDMVEYLFNNDQISIHCVHIFTLNDIHLVEKVLNKVKYK